MNGGPAHDLVALAGSQGFIDDGLLGPDRRALRDQVDGRDGVLAANHFVQRYRIGGPRSGNAVDEHIG